MFAYTAKQDGVVLQKTANGIIVQYKDQTKIGLQLGRVHGKAEGSIYPHDIISKLEVGDKFVKGDPLCYNTGFFEEDILNPKQIIMKNSFPVKTVLYESNQTLEDSSSISKKVSHLLNSKTTKVKSIVVDFKQNLINMVKVGQIIKPKDIIVIIEDSITSTTTAFDEESLLLLQNLSNQAIRSKHNAVIDKIEVLYHGDKSDMSASLKSLADKSDKLLSDIKISTNSPVFTGSVNSDYRVGGTPLALDKAEIKIYMTIETIAGVGDKGVYANQLKSVFGEVLETEIRTESGDEIDAIFGFRSIAARIVLSPSIIGTTTSLLKEIAKKAVQIYKG